MPDLDIVVLDDGSSDGTADVVATVAGDKVRLLDGKPLPAGWLGKPHACQQLADATPGAGVLVFVDADVEPEADAIAGAVALLRAQAAPCCRRTRRSSGWVGSSNRCCSGPG